MTDKTIGPRPLIFPPWVDVLVKRLGILAAFGAVYVVALVTFGFSPKTTDVGYMPDQPIPYSHKLHVGELGLDCRYCHTGVETIANATVPPTQTCMNCHEKIRPDSVQLAPLRESFKTGNPVQWVRVHDLADFSYFNHSAHVRRGIGCVSCHGRVDQMVKVYQAETLSMNFCNECHINPELHLRPLDKVTDLAWQPPADQVAKNLETMKEHGLLDENGNETWIKRRMINCSTCHR